MVQAVCAGVAGDDAGVEPGGGRSSGVHGNGVRRHGRGRRGVLRPPGGAVSVLDTVVWPVVGRRHAGDELGGGVCGEASCSCYGA